MRSRAERHLVMIAVAVSLALSGLTIWAVAAQAQAIRAREFADLRSAAETAAATRATALRLDTEQALKGATAAWVEGAAELEDWLTGRRDWQVVAARTAGGEWLILPRTPLEQELPGEEPAADPPASRDLLSVLRELQQRAMSPDPITRAGALLAMAAGEQQLGHPLVAASLFSEAAQILRSTPHLARLAFRAEAARIDSYLAAADHERARETFARFLAGLQLDPPTLLGPRELARLEQQAAAVPVRPDEPSAALLGEIRKRVQRREALLAAVRTELTADVPAGNGGPVFTSTPIGTRPPAARDAAGGDAGWVTLAWPGHVADRTVVLITTPEVLLGRYWSTVPADATWALRRGAGAEPVLVALGPAWGDAALVPSEARVEQMRAVARRQMGFVLATAVGTAGAWAVVIWMLLRAVARQRELARLQGRFVADVSHELKTPLALIRLLGETLVDRRVRDPERVHAYHETITREAERLSVLLDNILDLGRIESGRKVYEFETCDVAAVARQAWTLFEPQFREQGFDARLEIAPDLPRIRADGQALQQVLVNLLQNAHRYGADGKFVRLSVRREGYVVLMTVEDRGIGMSRNELDRLGESFFRADDTRVRQTRGTGLGLAICNHIVTAHRGKIEVQSRPGQGSTFTVWIPFE